MYINPQYATEDVFNRMNGKNGGISSYYSDIQRHLGRNPVTVNSLMAGMVNDWAEKFEAAIGSDLPRVEDRLVATQKLVDEMLKNYSPIAFTKNGNLEKYADGYLFKDEKRKFP